MPDLYLDIQRPACPSPRFIVHSYTRPLRRLSSCVKECELQSLKARFQRLVTEPETGVR